MGSEGREGEGMRGEREADSLGRTCFRNRTQEDEEEQEDEQDH